MTTQTTGPDYAWPTIADYEADSGFTVNEAFKRGWQMARTTNDLFQQMAEQANKGNEE
jgi:hypothetical protein